MDFPSVPVVTLVIFSKLPALHNHPAFHHPGPPCGLGSPEHAGVTQRPSSSRTLNSHSRQRVTFATKAVKTTGSRKDGRPNFLSRRMRGRKGPVIYISGTCTSWEPLNPFRNLGRRPRRTRLARLVQLLPGPLKVWPHGEQSPGLNHSGSVLPSRPPSTW